MSRFKGIFLDLDNTLYDYQTAHQPAINEVTSRYAGILGENTDKLLGLYNECRETFNQKLDGTASSHNRLLYFQHLCERLNVHAIPHALESYQLYWDVYIENIRIFDGVLTFLGNHQDKKIVIITDLTADVQHKKIERMGIAPMISFIVTSEEVGMEKPAPEIFQAALDKCGLNPEEVCMVGDNFDKDILGADNLGIKSFWLNRGGEKREHNKSVKEITKFDQLLELI